jgi:hypothetical protein
MIGISSQPGTGVPIFFVGAAVAGWLTSGAVDTAVDTETAGVGKGSAVWEHAGRIRRRSTIAIR